MTLLRRIRLEAGASFRSAHLRLTAGLADFCFCKGDGDGEAMSWSEDASKAWTAGGDSEV